MLEHGGRLREAAAHYGIPLADWLDLSTGINPVGWPVPAIPSQAWQRLPENDDGLEEAAAAYFGNHRLLAVPGSQAAITTLPRLFAQARVACLGSPVYAEHPHAWQSAGHHVSTYSHASLEAAANLTEIVVLCNPNNPTTESLSKERLLAAARKLAIRKCWLVVDEAFADATPEISLAPLAGTDEAPNLIVLRSLGKFFGLAGARVGFVIGAPQVLDPLSTLIGPWSLTGPSRWVATQALNDRQWQLETRAHLPPQSQGLAKLLAPLGEVASNPLFAYLHYPRAAELDVFLAQRGILVRRFESPHALRFGLPDSDAAWTRLGLALQDWNSPC